MTTPSIELMFKQSFDSIMELAGGLPDYSVEYQVDGFAAHILAAHILAAMQSAQKSEIDLSSAILSAMRSAKKKGRGAKK